MGVSVGVSVGASGYVYSCQWVCLQVPVDVFEVLSMGVSKCLVLSLFECVSEYRPVSVS